MVAAELINIQRMVCSMIGIRKTEKPAIGYDPLSDVLLSRGWTLCGCGYIKGVVTMFSHRFRLLL